MADQSTHNLPPRRASAADADRRSLGRRSAAVVRRWARDTFNREQLLSSLRALAWVAPLTLLIWIYAEREQQLSSPSQFQIVVKTTDRNQIASFVNGSDQNVAATLKGPKARVDKAIDLLDPRAGGGPVVIVIDGNRPPNQYEIDILAHIEKDQRLVDNGITVENCQPRSVRVDVDTLQEIDLAVRADPQARFVTPPTFDPATVRVTVPSAALRAVKGELYAKANLPPLPPGPHSLKAVPVTVDGLDPKITIRPTTVAAMLEVGQADVSHLVDSLPVFPTMAVDQQTLQNYTLRHDQFLSNVRVYGPPEKIRQLQSFTVTARPEAHFKVTDNDLGKQRITRELRYELPEGIRLGEDAPKTITFDLVPREAS